MGQEGRATAKEGKEVMIFKRGGIYWCDFTVNGERYRISLETTVRREATNGERGKIKKAENGLLAATLSESARATFAEAIDAWLEWRRSGIGRKKPLSAQSLKTEKERGSVVKKFLGSLPVKKIQAGTLHEYIASRRANVSAGTVNRELDVIRGVLKQAKRWSLMGGEVRNLPPGETTGRAFTPEEKSNLLATAQQKPEWQNARLALILALNTSMRPTEIKSLKWCDIDWLEKVVSLRVSKTAAGIRTIPLNSAAYAAVVELRERSVALFGASLAPEWHLFFSTHGKADPLRPVGHWRKAWKSVVKAAGVSQGRFYDSRHTAVTDLLQNPKVSEEVAKAIVGHVSRRMLERYSHQRMEAKRAAVDALASMPAESPTQPATQAEIPTPAPSYN
jgi:integrase